MKVQEVAGYEWANVRWLRRQVFECRIPYYKVGGRVLIDLADLDALVEASRHDAS
jgi:excisionase family DNA binding protein